MQIGLWLGAWDKRLWNADLLDNTFLCYCSVNKLLFGTQHLRLHYGKSRVKLGRKPGLTACEWCLSSRATCSSLQPLAVKWLQSYELRSLPLGVWLPGVKVSAIGSVTTREFHKRFLTQTRQLLSPIQVPCLFLLGQHSCCLLKSSNQGVSYLEPCGTGLVSQQCAEVNSCCRPPIFVWVKGLCEDFRTCLP